MQMQICFQFLENNIIKDDYLDGPSVFETMIQGFRGETT